jgi:hypothetical protein
MMNLHLLLARELQEMMVLQMLHLNLLIQMVNDMDVSVGNGSEVVVRLNLTRMTSDSSLNSWL